MNRLDRDSIDAALHLLDRQVVDADGLMVCNVDDLELTDSGGGRLAVTGLLAGGAALFPRLSQTLGSWLATTWHRLGAEHAHRNTPKRIALGLVAELGSAITLRVAREGLLDRQPDPAGGSTHRRLSELLGMSVHSASGEDLGNVLDVRLAPYGEEYQVHQLVVGRGRPGSLLGYDRGEVEGPWLLAWAVRKLHRHTGEVPYDRVGSIDWRDGRVTVDGGLDPLTRS
jgi:sporulation protein YlmC with PRC-barrel domain